MKVESITDRHNNISKCRLVLPDIVHGGVHLFSDKMHTAHLRL